MSEGILINPSFFVYFATITVTYPAGSTLTCTCGNDSFTAETTSGSYTFVVPYAGTWGIWATNGVQSKGAYVDVSYYNQAAYVTLTYETYLYNNGDTYSSITGGWQAWGDASNFSANDGGNLRYRVQAGYSEAFVWQGGVRPVNQILILNDTLHATFTYAKDLYNNDARVWIGLSTDGRRFITSVERRGAGDAALNVSAFKGGSYYVLINGTAGSEGGQINVKINNVYIN